MNSESRLINQNPQEKRKVEISPLSEEQRRFVLDYLRDIGYLNGKCFELSVCVNRLTQYPIYGLINSSGQIWHTGIKFPNGKYFDARGELNEEDFKSFDDTKDYELREVTIAELGNERLKKGILADSRGLDDLQIERAEKYILALYPDFSENSLEERTKRFLNELQKLSEEHGVFLRPMYPGSPMCIALVGEEENPVYSTGRTDDGGITVDRKFV